MRNWVRRALTKRVHKTVGGKQVEIAVPPSEGLVYGVTFAIVALISLTAIQIVHVIILKELNSEVLSATTLIIGTIMGVFFGKSLEK
mgnify:CR=1 FL=1